MKEFFELDDKELEQINGGVRPEKKRNERKSYNPKKAGPELVTCPRCHEPKIMHRVCTNCGYLEGKDIAGTE